MVDAIPATRTKVELPKMAVREPTPRHNFWELFLGDEGLCWTTSDDKALSMQEIAHRCNVHGELVDLAKSYQDTLERISTLTTGQGVRDAIAKSVNAIIATVAKAEGRAEASKPITDEDRSRIRVLEEAGHRTTRAEEDELRALHNREAEASEAEAAAKRRVDTKKDPAR